MNTNQSHICKGFWLAWVLTSLMGFSVGAFLGQSAWGIFPRHDGFDATTDIAFGIVMGATGGCLQMIVLREKVERAGLWVPASILDSLVATIAFPAAFAMNAVSYDPGALVLGLLFWGRVGSNPWRCAGLALASITLRRH